MSGTNDFIQFAPTDTGTNLDTLAAYLAATDRIDGNQPGVARSKLVNRALRQATAITAAFGSLASIQNLNTLDDGNLANLATALDLLFSNKKLISTNTNILLTAAQAGSELNASGTLTVTLPAAGTSRVGDRFDINATSAGGTVSVVASGGEVIRNLGDTTNITYSLKGGDFTSLRYTGSGVWVGVGGVQLSTMSIFGFSLSSNGYQKLPGGQIMQRGSFSASAAGDVAVSFPIAFPNAVRQITLGCQISTTGIFAGYNTPALSGFQGNAWVSTSVRANATVDYIAYGS